MKTGAGVGLLFISPLGIHMWYVIRIQLARPLSRLLDSRGASRRPGRGSLYRSMSQILCDLRQRKIVVLMKPDRDPTVVHHRRGGRKLLEELHSGACGHHAAPMTLDGNAFRQGFYWPTTIADAIELVRSCHECQFYAKQTHHLAHALQMIPSPGHLRSGASTS